MSTQKRKIGFYFLEIKENDELTDQKLIKKLLGIIINLSVLERKIEISGTNKMHLLSNLVTIQNVQNLIFISAKHHHIPPVIDSTTVNIRNNPKSITEGEMENTHIVLKYRKDGVILLLEERVVGVGIKTIVTYLNKFLTTKMNTDELKYRIEYSIIPSEGFLEELDNLTRVRMGEIHFDKSILGTEYLGIADRNEEVQEDVILTIKAKRLANLVRQIKDVSAVMADGTKPIFKIRVYGKSRDGSNIMLDSEFCRNIYYTPAIIDNLTGIVNSEDLFNKMNEMVQYA